MRRISRESRGSEGENAEEDCSALVARVRQGDEAALAELIQQYEEEVHLTARVLLGRALRPYLDSIDLVQSIYHTLLAGLRDNKIEVGTPQQFLGLAVTIVRRKVARHWRRLQRQKRLETIDLDTEEAGLTCLEEGPAEQAQYQDTVEHLCQQLEERDRRVVELRLQGFSTAEVARKLGLDADVLRVRLSRMRRRLRQNQVLLDWL